MQLTLCTFETYISQKYIPHKLVVPLLFEAQLAVRRVAVLQVEGEGVEGQQLLS